MTTATLETPVDVKPAEDPFHIGYRLRTFTDANGELVSEPVPLTEEDFLHPQEEDRFMLVDPHQRALHYLVHALRICYRNLPEGRVFTDHRIDWQVPGILPHGPDAVLFDRFTADWNGEGTLPVRDTNSRVLAVFEVTSESTRKIDLGKKFVEYALVGIPYYIIIDVAEPNDEINVNGYRLVNESYQPMRRDPQLGIILARAGLYFRWEDDRLIIADEDGKTIPDSRESGLAIDDLTAKVVVEAQRADSEAQRADAEKQRADAEKQRADAETQRADAERQRAEMLAGELAEFKARLDTQK